jgi:hypothetical protein
MYSIGAKMMRLWQVTSRAVRLAMIAVTMAIVVPAAYGQQAQAPSSGAMDAAKELITVTGATQLFNPLIAGVIEQARLLYLQQDPGLSNDLNEIATKMRTDLQPRFVQASNEVARLYATHFTEQELKEILAFYKSPTGKKLLSEQAIVIDNSMKFAQDWANKLSEEVVSAMRDELKKKGHAL